MGKFFLGLFFGAVAMAVYAYRNQIRAIIEHRGQIGSLAKGAEGASQVIDAAEEILQGLNAGN